ncbi:hypothetical protein JW916_05830 [Candidatus Sumerlaeota bacterium]|nr:hypothetical protein [Candidatus Sumerlaeota bacterium]
MNEWTTHTSEYPEVLRRVSAIAEENGYRLNPDLDRVAKVVGLMTNNWVETGKYVCPCKQSHPVDPAVDVVCPCPPWTEEITQQGYCFCRLFYTDPDRAERKGDAGGKTHCAPRSARPSS